MHIKNSIKLINTAQSYFNKNEVGNEISKVTNDGLVTLLLQRYG